MRTRGGILLANILTGLALGFTVTSIGFGDFTELNRMFTFQDLRMLLSFAGAVVIIACVFALLRIRRTRGRIHAGLIPGAVLFGQAGRSPVAARQSRSHRWRAVTCPPWSRSPESSSASGSAVGPGPGTFASTTVPADSET
jgi:hypothetical protein